MCLCVNTYLARFNFFFFNDTATTEIYTLSLHDALPIHQQPRRPRHPCATGRPDTAARTCRRVMEESIGRRDQPVAGSMTADIEPLQRGMSGSGPKAWIWSRFNSAFSRFVVATMTRPVVCTSIAIL